MIVNQILESIALTLSASSFLISVFTLIYIVIYIRPLMSNVSILLTCNTYITLIGSSFMTVLVLIYGLLDTRNSSIFFNDFSCQIRSYINYVFICAFFYSCALQAIFRLFRVVFSKYRILQTRNVFMLAIFVQFLIAFLYIAAYFILENFEYHSDIGSCWLSFKNIPALATAMIFVYASPLTVMIVIYVCIIRHIRHAVQTQEIRQQSNKRDLVIVKRMIILVLISMAIGIPTGIILIIYMITHYLHSLAYHIQALSLTLGFIVESIVLGLATPQVQEIFNKNRRQIVPTNAEHRTVE